MRVSILSFDSKMTSTSFSYPFFSFLHVFIACTYIGLIQILVDKEPVSAPGPTKGTAIYKHYAKLVYALINCKDVSMCCKNVCEKCVSLNAIKGVFTDPNTAAPLEQKIKIPVQDDKGSESTQLKSKVSILLQEKEQKMEIIKLKNVPVKPPVPEKEVFTHEAEMTRHYNPDLMVHGLHDREDREIMTLGKIERIFKAEEETILLNYFEKAERIAVAEKTEALGWKRPLKTQKEKEPEVLNVDTKRIVALPKGNEPKELVKPKFSEKPGKPEDEPQKIKSKKVPTKPKGLEKDIVTHKVEVTKHCDTELTAQKLYDREDREVLSVQRTEQIFTADQEESELGHMGAPEKVEAEDEKSRWTGTPRTPQRDECESDITEKKINILPKKEEKHERVTLKPFEEPQKPDTDENPMAETEGEARTNAEHTPFVRTEMSLRDQNNSATGHREEDFQLTCPKVTPGVSKDLYEFPLETNVPRDGRVISSPGNEKTPLMLKHFTKEKPDEVFEEEKKKPGDIKESSPVPIDDIPEEVMEPQLWSNEITEEAQEEGTEETTSPPRKPSLSKNIAEKTIELKKTSSSSKDRVEEKMSYKPTEQLKKVELRKTLSPKVEKPKHKDLESICVETEPGAGKVKQFPQTVSPSDSEVVPKKPSTEDSSGAEKPSREHIPLGKEVSPGAIQMKKVPTPSQEEVVFKEETDDISADEEEEVWSWELVPSEDWECEGLDGVMESPGPPGSKQGEVKKEMPLELPHPSQMTLLIIVSSTD